MKDETILGGAEKDFPDTVRGLFSRATASATDVRQSGLEEFARTYWKPVYAYIRSAWGKSNEDSKDLTQAFFLWIVDGDALVRYAPERASFRRYLKSLVRHFVQHEDQARHRLKRGGGVQVLSIDALGAAPAWLEGRPAGEDPERTFDRVWKKTLIAEALERVRKRHPSDDRFRVFEEYDLRSGPERPTYKEVAARLRLKETDVRNYLFGVREEIRQEIRQELARLTQNRDDLEEEWRALFGG